MSPAAKPKHSKKAVAKKTTAKKPKIKKTKAPKKFTFLAVAVVVIWMGIAVTRNCLQIRGVPEGQCA